ncbi:uncharacterized protein METZ01_LOCUS390395, partial [marine metagenome]
RTEQDCQVYAFLYRSDGERVELISDNAVYRNRWIYVPDEFGFTALGEADVVYTLYFLAAPHLDEDRGQLWEEVENLQSQGRFDRYEGLELLDAEVVRYLQRTVAVDSLSIQRGEEGIERPRERRRFVYRDGSTLSSSGELYRSLVVARAVSTLIEYR